jgi:DNA ligase-1
METSDGLLVVDVTVKNEKLRDLIDANPDDFIGRIWAVISW